MYERLGFRNLPPIPIGTDRTSPEYRAFRAEADERLRRIRERLEREEAEAAARRRAEDGE